MHALIALATADQRLAPLRDMELGREFDGLHGGISVEGFDVLVAEKRSFSKAP